MHYVVYMGCVKILSIFWQNITIQASCFLNPGDMLSEHFSNLTSVSGCIGLVYILHIFVLSGQRLERE